MALEQSINRDAKMHGGIIGISQKPAALERWFLTCHERAYITNSLKLMCGIQDISSDNYKDSSSGRSKKDEEDVNQLVKTMKSGLIRNPFDIEDADTYSKYPLLNIATSVIMPQDSTDKLLNAYESGKSHMTISSLKKD